MTQETNTTDSSITVTLSSKEADIVRYALLRATGIEGGSMGPEFECAYCDSVWYDPDWEDEEHEQDCCRKELQKKFEAVK